MNAQEQAKKKLAQMDKAEQIEVERKAKEAEKKRIEAENKRKSDERKRKAAQAAAQQEEIRRKEAEKKLADEKEQERKIRNEMSGMRPRGPQIPHSDGHDNSDVHSRRVQQAQERLNINKIEENKKQQQANEEQIKIGRRYV